MAPHSRDLRAKVLQMTAEPADVPSDGSSRGPSRGIGLTEVDLENAALGELAATLAVEAARFAHEGQAALTGADIDRKSTATDLVTAMDRATEALIRERLAEARPGDAILGEEAGGADPAPGQVQWVVDPIDGTVNYVHGYQGWCVSIAAQRDGESVAGAVALIEFDELFTAVRGQGAVLSRLDGSNRTALGLDAPPPLGRALVATGFGYDARLRVVQGQVVAALLPQIADIRRGGSAAMDLCAVAAGRVDAYFERGPHLWDHAAGSLIATEAGARFSVDSTPDGDVICVAADPLFTELTAQLQALGWDQAL